MPACNVTTDWVDGNLVVYDVDKNIILTFDATNRKVTFPSGSTLESAGTVTIPNGTITAAKLASDAVETAKVKDAAITSAKFASGAGVAALLTAGLGGSHSVVKTETGTHTIVAAHGTKDRACLALVYVDEAFANGDTTATVIEVGETDTIDKCIDHTLLVDGVAAGTVYCRAFTNTATKAIIATSTAAAGTGTGGASITVLAIPTT